MAVVSIAPASLPAFASVKAKAASCSPAAICAKYFCFCSSVPAIKIGYIPKPVAPKANEIPTSTAQSSSVTTAKSATLPLIPPYSSGTKIAKRSLCFITSTMSQGKMPSSSYFSETGLIFSSAIRRAISCISNCSSVKK
ncbi:MAG: hypothetical protein BWX63_02085 [Bacteroidetes bacterium ADurb.Bin041]|nr:MAG: hypothetical protein BWX63_02085 [Bacteroidetes bacterium ADurb.Bin041]